MDLFCDIFRRFRITKSGRRISKISNRKCIKSFMREVCGYLACISVRNKLKLLSTCQGDPTAGLIRDNGNAVEIAGFLIDDTNPERLGVSLHQYDGYFEKRCDPVVCSCGNIIESDENTEDDGESVEDFDGVDDELFSFAWS